jgi:hypothetical protein
MAKKLLFLGGTCGGSQWREELMNKLLARGVPPESFFNPVRRDWNDEARRQEEDAKAKASHLLFYLTSPVEEGNPISSFSMVEATMALYDRPLQTVVAFDTRGVSGHFLRSMTQAFKLLKERFPKGNIFETSEEVTNWLTSQFV